MQLQVIKKFLPYEIGEIYETKSTDFCNYSKHEKCPRGHSYEECLGEVQGDCVIFLLENKVMRIIDENEIRAQKTRETINTVREMKIFNDNALKSLEEYRGDNYE